MKMPVAIIHAIALILLMVVSGTASAQIALPVQPNMYEFTGKRVKITYSTTSIPGEPRLSYRDRTRTLQFKGDEIRVTPTEIGQLVTVTLEVIPDLRVVTLTLLIPAINLQSDVVIFKTEAITTTHRTSIGGPALVKGALQSYSTQTLLGEASLVTFLNGQSAVIGEVTLSPTCPGPQKPDQSCEKPFAGATVQILDGYRMVVGSGTTNADGFFLIEIPAGEYTAHIEINSRLPRCPDVPFSVTEQGRAFVQIDCDTGIR